MSEKKSESVRKILALDIGSQSVGVAVGDFSRLRAGFMPKSLKAFAMPESKHALCKCIFSLVCEYRIDTLVLGYPLPSVSAARSSFIFPDFSSKKGDHFSEKAQKLPKNNRNQSLRKTIKALVRRIENYVAIQQKKGKNTFPFRVLLHDEHLTTYSAKSSPFFAQWSQNKGDFPQKVSKNFSHTKNIDSFAACEILLSWVNEIIRQRR